MNATFQDPVLVDLLTGDVYQLDDYQIQSNAASFEGLPLTDFPMAIIESDEIKYY